MPDELNPRHLRRRLLELVFLGALVAGAITTLPGLGEVRRRFAHAAPLPIALSLVAELLSCLSYVVVFRGVFCARMSWRFSYQLGMAEQATNVLLPTGGAGGLALGVWALRQGGMPTEHIGRRSVAFFLITSTPNFVCAAVFGTLLATGAFGGHARVAVSATFAALAVVAIVLVWLAPRPLSRVGEPPGAGRIRHVTARVAAILADGVRDTGALLRSRSPSVLGGSVGYMALDVAALAAAFAAFGSSPSFGVFVFAYTIGQLGGLIPLPGGIGGNDSGLIGALVLYGTPASQAAAAVLAYRAFQLGIPAILGGIAFVQLRRTLAGSEAPAALCAPMADEVVELPLPGEAVPVRHSG